MTTSYTADALIARILFVTPAQANAPTQSAQRPFNVSLLVSALRCIVQYVLLPFVLPLVGLAAQPPIGLAIAFDVVALLSLITSLRRFWRVQHPRRWDYLPLALVMALAIIVFIVNDLCAL